MLDTTMGKVGMHHRRYLEAQMAEPCTPPQQQGSTLHNLIRRNVPAGASLRVQVAGSSMQPTLRPGDTLLLERGTVASVRPGDLLTVQIGSQLQTHRLLRRTASHLYTRGDACVQSDPPTPTTALIGRVQQIERSGEPPFAEPRWLQQLQLALSRIDAASLPLGVLAVAVRRGTALLRRVGLGVAHTQQRSRP